MLRAKFLITALLFVGFSLHAVAETNVETARLHVSKSVIDTLFNEMPIDKSESIRKYLDDTFVRGSARTKGTTSYSFVPHPTRALFELNFDLTTESNTVGENHPRKKIEVDIQTKSTTATNAKLIIEVRPGEIVAGPPSAAAHTALRAVGYNVEATGLLGGHFRRKGAYAQAPGQFEMKRPQNERQISDEAVRTTLKQITEDSKPLVTSLNHDFNDVLYAPLFKPNGKIPGVLHLNTTSDNIVSRITSQVSDADWAEFRAARELPNADMAFTIHQSLMNAALERRLAGKTLNEDELESLFVENSLPVDVRDHGPKDKQARLTFCERRPSGWEFVNDKVNFRFCAKTIRLPDGELGLTWLTARYAVEVSRTGHLRLSRESSLRLTETKDSARDTKKLSEEATRRYTSLFPETMELGRMQLPSKKGVAKRLEVRKANTADGWLTVEWGIQ